MDCHALSGLVLGLSLVSLSFVIFLPLTPWYSVHINFIESGQQLDISYFAYPGLGSGRDREVIMSSKFGGAVMMCVGVNTILAGLHLLCLGLYAISRQTLRLFFILVVGVLLTLYSVLLLLAVIMFCTSIPDEGFPLERCKRFSYSGTVQGRGTEQVKCRPKAAFILAVLCVTVLVPSLWWWFWILFCRFKLRRHRLAQEQSSFQSL